MRLRSRCIYYRGLFVVQNYINYFKRLNKSDKNTIIDEIDMII